ncbi:hypothetical protein ACU686_26305 [Yinghuangia aomiensis]
MTGPQSMEARRRGVAGVAAAAALLALVVVLAWWGWSARGGSDPAAPVAESSPSASGPGASPSSPVTAASRSGPPPATAPAQMPAASPIPRGSGTPDVPLPRVDLVDTRDATAVSQAAMTVWFTSDTVADTSLQDAVVRAAPWMTQEFAAAQAFTPVAGSRAQWTEWTAHRAYTVVSLVASQEVGAPPDGDVEAYRKWRVTVTPTGRDGWRGSTAGLGGVRATGAWIGRGGVAGG